MASRFLKVSSLATAAVAFSGIYLHNRQLDFSDLSVIRFGRAAATVSYSTISDLEWQDKYVFCITIYCQKMWPNHHPLTENHHSTFKLVVEKKYELTRDDYYLGCILISLLSLCCDPGRSVLGRVASLKVFETNLLALPTSCKSAILDHRFSESSE